MMRKQMSNDESGDELAAAFRIFDKVREYGAFSFIATCFYLARVPCGCRLRCKK